MLTHIYTHIDYFPTIKEFISKAIKEDSCINNAKQVIKFTLQFYKYTIMISVPNDRSKEKDPKRYCGELF